MRILTFNVNGIKSMNTKDKAGKKDCTPATNCLSTLIAEQKPDILCLQEIRCQTEAELSAYKTTHPYIYTNHSTAKKGYSGTAILSRTEPVAVYKDFAFAPNIVPEDKKDLALFKEGRLLTLEFSNYFVVCVYTPNSKDELARLNERLLWDTIYMIYLLALQETKKYVIACGDFNCAKERIDIHKPEGHQRSAGFSPEERESFCKILDSSKLIDTFRELHPDLVKYTYWSNMRRSRESNKGWRIDYILLSEALRPHLQSSDVLSEYFGSDHCPVIAEIEV